MLKVHLGTLAVLLLCGGSLVRAGEGGCRSIATNSGHAVTVVKGEGDGGYYGTASANNGRADTRVEGGGFSGGYADVRGDSVADGGEAKAFAKGRANGGYVGSTAIAVTKNGRSDARNWACSSGNAEASSDTSAFSGEGGVAWARGGAEATGHGGVAVSRNTTHSESWGGQADSESVASSVAKHDGRADSESDVMAFSRPGRMAQARFTSEANASYGGIANSRGFLRNVR